MNTFSPPHAGCLFPKKILVTALFLAFATPATFAQYQSNIELYAKPGTERNYLGIDALVPLVQTGTAMVFGDLKAHVTDTDINEINLGLGYRALTTDQQWAWGVYGAIDNKHTVAGNNFNQATLGAEMRSREWDVRTNVYQSLTDKKLMGLGGANHFAGSNVWRNGVYEEVLSGADIEVGRLLDFVPKYETRAYVAAYSLKGKDVAPQADGARVRLEFRPRKDITLGVSYQHDNVFGNAAFLELRYTIGKTPESGIRTLIERMTDPWKRDQDIVTSGAFESSNPGYSVQSTDKMVHINNAAVSGGDGSFEHPYDSVVSCEGEGKCSQLTNGVGAYNMIRLWQGHSAELGEPMTYTSFTLQDGQTLWGQGYDIYTGRVLSGQHPVIDNYSLGHGVGLASSSSLGNSVYGVKIIGPGFGISGSNTGGQVKLIGNIIDTGGPGIYLSNSGFGMTPLLRSMDVPVSTSFSQNVMITDNNITSYGGGILLDTYNSDPSIQFTQTTAISGNTINTNGRGISIHNTSDSHSQSGQTVTLSNNTVRSEASSGIWLENIAAGDTSLALQTVTIASNKIEARDEGIHATNSAAAVFTSNTASQRLTISGNTLSTGQTGIFLGNGASVQSPMPTTTATQIATISDNTITGNPSNMRSVGIDIENFDDGHHDAVQAVTVSGSNKVTGFGAGLIVLSQGSVVPASSQTVTVTGLTVMTPTLDNATGPAILKCNRGTSTQTVTVGSANTLDGLPVTTATECQQLQPPK